MLETLYLWASADGNVIVNLRSFFFLVNVIVAWPVTMFYKINIVGKIATETGFQQRPKLLIK